MSAKVSNRQWLLLNKAKSDFGGTDQYTLLNTEGTTSVKIQERGIVGNLEYPIVRKLSESPDRVRGASCNGRADAPDPVKPRPKEQRAWTVSYRSRLRQFYRK